MSSDPIPSSDRPQPDVAAEAPEVAGPPPRSAVKFTKTSAAWWALAVGVLILVILLIFIAQNSDSIPISFLGWHWTSPTGITILLSAVGGVVITLAAGTARMIQLRRAARKNLRAR